MAGRLSKNKTYTVTFYKGEFIRERTVKQIGTLSFDDKAGHFVLRNNQGKRIASAANLAFLRAAGYTVTISYKANPAILNEKPEMVAVA